MGLVPNPDAPPIVRSKAVFEDAERTAVAGNGEPLLDLVLGSLEGDDVPRFLPRKSGRRRPCCPHDSLEMIVGMSTWHVVVPVRGAHDALRRCLRSLGELEDANTFDVRIVCHEAEYDAVSDAVDGSGLSFYSIVRTTAPAGFARNCNEGVESAWPDTDVVVFLNSDCDVSALGSLRGAFAHALTYADCVGPAGTNVSGFQNFPPARVDRWGVHDLRRLSSVVKPDTPRLVGFCLAVRYGAFLDVGGWDESFGIGNFDDDDLCLRLALRSRPGEPSLLFVPWVVVKHEGSASFRELPDAEATYKRAMTENAARFGQRWGGVLPWICGWWNSL